MFGGAVPDEQGDTPVRHDKITTPLISGAGLETRDHRHSAVSLGENASQQGTKSTKLEKRSEK